VATDPVNLVFFGQGAAANVAHHLSHSLLPAWHVTSMSGQMYAYIDDQIHGARAGWKAPDQTLVIGPVIGPSRLHVRIYEGFVACHHPTGTFGTWSIASVHREHYVPPAWHVVHGWKEPQEIVRDALLRTRAEQPFVGRIFDNDVGNAGLYQGYWFDGQVTFVELLW
jgi:hypothetical protein